MPPVKGHKQLADAVFTSINEGIYATDQDVASAEVPSAALQSLSSLLEKARVDVKNSISELSRLSATDIDGWIAQAKQLRLDITQSGNQSQEIVAFAEGGASLKEEAQDVLAKVKLLDSEVAFNDTVVDTLKDVQDVKQKTDQISFKLNQGQLLDASGLLKQTSVQVKALEKRAGPRLVKVLDERNERKRSAILNAVEESWSKLVTIDRPTHRCTIHNQVTASFGGVDLEQLAQSLDVLDLLHGKTSELAAALAEAILDPLLQDTSASGYSLVFEKENTAELVPSTRTVSIEATFKDLAALQTYCRLRMPQDMHSHFGIKLDAMIVEKLLSSTLASVVPLDLSGLTSFQQTVEQVKSFAASLDKQSRNSSQKLLNWASNAPNVWLAKRSQESLDSVRKLLKRGLGQPRQVERVETQTVSHQDEMFAANGTQDDWNASWSDEEDQDKLGQTEMRPQSPQKNGTQAEEEDEGMAGWGFDDEIEPTTDSTKADGTAIHAREQENKTEEGDGDAWGWGDDPESPTQVHSTRPTRNIESQQTNETANTGSQSLKPQEREITLRETYYITALPEQILDIVVMVIEDANSLTSASPVNPIVAAAKGLYQLPGSLLSMFRASAPTFYGNDINGSMFMYNDSLYLSEQLRSYLKHHQDRQPNATSLSTLTETDIPDLETFGKRAYGKDMESKRTTLIDLLDGAQGFSNCTQEPFASQCDLAISSVIDFLQQTHSHWSRVLSRSALLQSTGSLLTTITNKMIVDVEDMGDISEPESQRLVSFCKSITTLENLFLPESGENDQETVIPLTAAYTKTWLRFQYLSNILESSLIDIKYLWTEGELSIEFTVDEVTDLIEALFADSDHRRRAIAEIRRSR